MSERRLNNFVGGEWRAVDSERWQTVCNPATGEELAKVPFSSKKEVDSVIETAHAAFEDWRMVPPVERVRYLFKYKSLLDTYKEDLAQMVTKEHGKTLAESRGSVRRGIENVEHACGMPALLMGESLQDVARGIDTQSLRQPLGVFAGITPFNFPAMVPLWFWPYALASGNTYIVKPSEQVPLTQELQFELIEKAGFPQGIINMVHGGREASEALIDHPLVKGISFVGSTRVAQAVYARAAGLGKRVQALGGAKNHVIVMPDAVVEPTVDAVIESAYGCAGQRCLAASVAVLVGDAYEIFRDKLIERAASLKMGNGTEDGVELGPVIGVGAQDRILSMIEAGVQDGAELVLDGRQQKVAGCDGGTWVGATMFDKVTPEMSLAKEEVFGPVLALSQVDTLEEAIQRVKDSPYANATSIFTSSGKAARTFQHEAGVSMMGVNIGVAAPMAFFPFGGTKSSFFGDVKAHGRDSVRFFTDAKVVISRWF